MRRVVVAGLVATVLGAAAVLGTASAQRVPRFELAQLQAGRVAFRDTILDAKRLPAFAIRTGFWGGPVTASTGEVVNISVSDSIPQDPAFPQSVADFLVQLDHGNELGTVSIYLVPAAEVQQLCGPSVGGCYNPQQKRLVSPAEDLPTGVSSETILAHELGHHIAASRDNAPWPAIDWGPKRWASAVNVCTRNGQGTAFPGDEGEHYSQNPGEAWAETYRLLNFQKTTWPSWVFTEFNADGSFYPNAAALEAARRDVLEPWAKTPVAAWSATFRAPKAKPAATPKTKPKPKSARKAKPKPRPLKLAPKKRTIATLLDGEFSASLGRAPTGTTLTLSDSTGNVLAGPARTVSALVCGQRSLVVTVKATRTGPFTTTISNP